MERMYYLITKIIEKYERTVDESMNVPQVADHHKSYYLTPAGFEEIFHPRTQNRANSIDQDFSFEKKDNSPDI